MTRKDRFPESAEPVLESVAANLGFTAPRWKGNLRRIEGSVGGYKTQIEAIPVRAGGEGSILPPQWAWKAWFNHKLPRRRWFGDRADPITDPDARSIYKRLHRERSVVKIRRRRVTVTNYDLTIGPDKIESVMRDLVELVAHLESNPPSDW